MDQPKLFGRRVKTARKAAKLSQEELAELTHLNAKYLGQIERGEKSPSFEVIIALGKSLRVSPALFFNFDREEIDEKVLRKKIDLLLHESDLRQLQLIHRFTRVIMEP